MEPSQKRLEMMKSLAMMHQHGQGQNQKQDQNQALRPMFANVMFPVPMPMQQNSTAIASDLNLKLNLDMLAASAQLGNLNLPTLQNQEMAPLNLTPIQMQILQLSGMNMSYPTMNMNSINLLDPANLNLLMGGGFGLGDMAGSGGSNLVYPIPEPVSFHDESRKRKRTEMQQQIPSHQGQDGITANIEIGSDEDGEFPKHQARQQKKYAREKERRLRITHLYEEIAKCLRGIVPKSCLFTRNIYRVDLLQVLVHVLESEYNITKPSDADQNSVSRPSEDRNVHPHLEGTTRRARKSTKEKERRNNVRYWCGIVSEMLDLKGETDQLVILKYVLKFLLAKTGTKPEIQDLEESSQKISENKQVV